MKAEYRALSFSAHRIKITIEGFRIDRLLDKASRSGIDMRNIRIISPLKAVCWVTPKDLAELRKKAKALYRITEAEHRGVEYRIKKFMKTPLKAVGVIVVLAVVASQSFFIKTVEISGYKGIPETLLRECLSESGVREGAYRPNIDWKAAENHVYETFPQITWLKLVYDGRKVFLDIAEAENPIMTEDTALSDERKYTNIIAARSGYVDTVSVYRGMLLTEEGEYVKKGQVLVCGYVPIEPTVYDENHPKGYYVRCRGEIWAKIPYRLVFNQERYISPRGKAGTESGNSQGNGNGDSRGIEDSQEKTGSQGDSGSGKDRAAKKGGGLNTVLSKREKSEDEIRAKADQQIRQWAKENLPEDAEILNKDLNFSRKENIIEIGVTLEVRQQIGEEQEILIGEESTDTSGD